MRKLKIIEFQKLELLYIQLVVRIILAFLIIQLVFLTAEMKMYLSCIYCPLVYLFLVQKNNYFLNEINYRVVSIQVSVYLVTVLLSVVSSRYVFAVWILIYFITYIIAINIELNKQTILKTQSNSNYLISLFRLWIILALFYTVLRIVEMYYGSLFSWSTKNIGIEIVLVNILFTAGVLCSLKKVKRTLEQQRKNSISCHNLRTEIIVFFNTSDLYLDPKFSITDLARILNRQKGDISRVINRELNRSFYLLVAQYRINYAKYMLLAPHPSSINAIVKQCGFHSRSTFYKYFQEFVGCKPYEFRNEHFEKDAERHNTNNNLMK